MPLLDAEFVRELERIKRRLDTDARSFGSGHRTSPRGGNATQFSQHRHYTPGDDPRRIDWLAFARSGLPMLKQYQAEEDTIGRILLDHSASLGFGSPPKLDAAKKIAGALSYLWLASGLRCQLIGLRPAPALPPPGTTTSHTQWYATRRGRPLIASVLRELESLNATGPTNLARWVTQVVGQARRPGILVILSDFLDPQPVLPALDRARAKGHEVVLVQVLAEEELTPLIGGDLELSDAETAESLRVSIDAESLEAYHRGLNHLRNSLRMWAKTRGQTYQLVSPTDPLGPVLLTLISDRRAARSVG